MVPLERWEEEGLWGTKWLSDPESTETSRVIGLGLGLRPGQGTQEAAGTEEWSHGLGQVVHGRQWSEKFQEKRDEVPSAQGCEGHTRLRLACLGHVIRLQGHFEPWLELGGAGSEAPGAQSGDAAQPRPDGPTRTPRPDSGGCWHQDLFCIVLNSFIEIPLAYHVCVRVCI